MRKHLIYLICGWVLGVSNLLLAQDRIVSGQLLVSLETGITPADLLETYANEGEIIYQSANRISALNNIWLIHFNENIVRREKITTFFKSLKEVRHAQPNHYVHDRSSTPERNSSPNWRPEQELQVSPNDPYFAYQWHLENTGQGGGLPGADLGAVPAWDITTGGVTPAGDTVVVAVIDGGICPYCDEFGDNLWVNHHEIPNDGIDNDGNGYFDDYRGWNVNAQNDEIIGYSSGHGTSVAGIIGAKGNNGVGISGVMWNTKLMFVAGTSGILTTESQILSAYEYVWKARKTYNETNGEKGAYVVAVNCSFGINFSTPEQSPLWCEIIDQLGQVGILTIAAAANGSWNVDELGDIPTTCPSDYLISVTSLDFEDIKSYNASWGPTSVDLGAYGSNIYTLTVGPYNYGVVSGTSFAAPEVAGATGLLYTAPCANLAALSKENPAIAAQTAKDLILSSARPNSSLDSITRTGKRLHLQDLLVQYTGNCSDCPAPYWLNAIPIDTNTMAITWVNTQEIGQVNLRWKQSADTLWQLVENASTPFLLHNLSACTQYEFAVQSVCDSLITANWTIEKTFTTNGCCTAPEITAISATASTATIRWKKVEAAHYYNLKYRINQAGDWYLIPGIIADSFAITGITACTSVEASLQTYCASGFTNFSENTIFKTTGCGACYDMNYCNAKANSAQEEWIASIVIGYDWSHESLGYQGYQDFSGQASVPPLYLFPGQSMQATIYPGFVGLPYHEMYRIFVDFNLDGDFEDNGELVFDPGFSHDGPLTGDFITPYFTSEGITRMRVIMKFKSSGFLNLPLPCEKFDYGQVEDYCVHLTPFLSGEHQGLQKNGPIVIYPNPVGDYFILESPQTNNPILQGNISFTDLTGKEVPFSQMAYSDSGIKVNIKRQLPPGIYYVRITDAVTRQQTFIGKIVKGE